MQLASVLKLGKITPGDKSRRSDSNKNNVQLLPRFAITLRIRKSILTLAAHTHGMFMYIQDYMLQILTWGGRGIWRLLNSDYVMRMDFPLWDSGSHWPPMLGFSTSLSLTLALSPPSPLSSLHLYISFRETEKIVRTQQYLFTKVRAHPCK